MANPTARILGPDGRPFSVRAPRVRGRYDAAQTNTDNARLWVLADGLSARSANSPEVRRKLRERARYEASNNSYARGIVETLANDLVGTGPRLQLMTGNPEMNDRVAREFDTWAAAVGLAEKLRTMKKARTVDGEAFALLVSNPRLPTEVQLDLRLVETEQVATPDLWMTSPQNVDGITFDRFGNPLEYHLLDDHPGDEMRIGRMLGYTRIRADLVIHWFRCDRPGQARGVPDLTPAIPLFAQLRRYTLAVLAAAETAADFAAVLFSELPAEADAVEGEPFETLEIEKRMMTTLPAGWKLAQLKAEQPATTYDMFKREILNEIARCLNVPYNVAAGNSSAYNYASGRLDHQVYHRSLAVDQYHLETAVLDRLFRAWLEEAYLARVVPEPPDRLEGWPHQWFWDGPEHVDPEKEANAQETRLANHTTTLADEWARRGHDWRERLRQRAEELKLMAQLGLTPAQAAPSPTPNTQPAGGLDDVDDTED
jgi:lambda family phage portal protein